MVDLFIVGPHSKNQNGLILFNHFINQSMLNVNAAGDTAFKSSSQFFEGRRGLIGIF